MRKILTILLVAGLLLLSVGSLLAQRTMSVVPQNVGFPDTKFSGMTKESCASCHDDPVGDTHHGTKNALAGKCGACHTISKDAGKAGVSMHRDCMKCHTKSPHHATAEAKNNECTACHDSPGVDDYDPNRAPGYAVSKLTPTTDSCSNCHRAGTWKKLAIVSIKDTHHGTSLRQCKTCHDTKDKKSKNIRLCERCHGAKAIHAVPAHVDENACSGCHQPVARKK